MDNYEILEVLNGIFRDKLDDDNITLTPETTAKDVKGWDSLTHIRLIISIEKKLKIRFTSTEIANFKNVGDIIAIIEKKLPDA